MYRRDQDVNLALQTKKKVLQENTDSIPSMGVVHVVCTISCVILIQMR